MSDAVELPPDSGAAPPGAAQTPFWRLLLWTPIGELLQGRVTGPVSRASAAGPIALPAILESVVADVVAHTRLWSGEQREIKRELSAHFLDGLESGCSPEQLLADFGDPVQAARLLRRAAKRNRRWPWRAMRFALRATTAALLAILLLYGLMAARFYFGRPTISSDYRVPMNAAAKAVPEQDRAWPLYREALLALPKNAPEAMDNSRSNRAPLPGEQGWDTVEAYLRDAAPALEFARHAGERHGMGFVVGYPWSPEDQRLWPESIVDEQEFISPDGYGMISVLLPHLGSLRRLSRALGWDMQRAAAAGDGTTVLADLRAILAISRNCRETSTLISDLVGLAVFAIGRDRIDAILAQTPEVLSDAQWIEAAHALAAFDDATLHISLRGERLFFGDVLQRMYTDDGSGDGRLTPRGLRWLDSASDGVDDETTQALMAIGGPALGSVMLGRRDMQEQYERLIGMYEAEAATPLWLRDDSPAELILHEWMASPVQRMRHLPLCLMMPAIGKAAINSEMTKMRRDATLTAIALNLYRRKHGNWPATLDQLVPSLLPVMPVDRFDGRPLRFTVKDGAPMVYSVGSDREDDGGVLPPFGASNSGSRQFYAQQWMSPSQVKARQERTTVLADGRSVNEWDGDWILWPPLPEQPLIVDDRPSAP